MLTELLLRMVLEYLGASEGRKLRRVGSSRSAVRAIGASLPWSPERTPSLNIPHSKTLATRKRLGTAVCSLPNAVSALADGGCRVASFADVGWLNSDDIIHDDDPEECFLPKDDIEEEREEEEEEEEEEPEEEESSSPPDPNAMAKISALEVELANLRAQLAMVVKHQETAASPAPPPAPCASAAVPTPACPYVAVAAPPPPPPPPPPGLLKVEEVNVIEEIRKARAARNGRTLTDDSGDKQGLDMGNVIKQLGSVKLRTVQRSPGGTPIRQKPRQDANDPASIIANALQRKFAHCKLPSSARDTPDCDDDEFESENIEPTRESVSVPKVNPASRRVISPRRASPRKRNGVSPAAKKPMFGQHMLRRSSRKA